MCREFLFQQDNFFRVSFYLKKKKQGLPWQPNPLPWEWLGLLAFTA